MKKLALIIVALILITGAPVLFNGCATSVKVTSKSGSQLWGENCIRCHNAPSSSEYSGVQWETIGLHMRTRANLTDAETKKIVDFLKSGN